MFILNISNKYKRQQYYILKYICVARKNKNYICRCTQQPIMTSNNSKRRQVLLIIVAIIAGFPQGYRVFSGEGGLPSIIAFVGFLLLALICSYQLYYLRKETSKEIN
jgi:hypothetical protein